MLWPVTTLPQKLALAGLAAVLFIGVILGGVWAIYAKGAQAAEDAAKARHLEELQKHAEAVNEALNTLQINLETALADDFDNLGTRIGQIDITEKTIIRPTLVREIQNDSQLSDPNFVLPDGVRGAINQARAESACPERATGGDCATLSPPPDAR